MLLLLFSDTGSCLLPPCYIINYLLLWETKPNQALSLSNIVWNPFNETLTIFQTLTLRQINECQSFAHSHFLDCNCTQPVSIIITTWVTLTSIPLYQIQRTRHLWMECFHSKYNAYEWMNESMSSWQSPNFEEESCKYLPASIRLYFHSISILYSTSVRYDGPRESSRYLL